MERLQSNAAIYSFIHPLPISRSLSTSVGAEHDVCCLGVKGGYIQQQNCRQLIKCTHFSEVGEMGNASHKTFLESLKFVEHFHFSERPEKVFLEKLASLD